MAFYDKYIPKELKRPVDKLLDFGTDTFKKTGRAVRKLTPRECARIMGFDDNKEMQMIIPVSDTRAYQQFGNSVVVPVIKQIATYMKPFIMQQFKKA